MTTNPIDTLVPSLEPAGLRVLDYELSLATVYLEYGSGGSTLRAALQGQRTVVSIDSNADWIGKVQTFLAKDDRLSKNVHLLKACIGPVVAWGRPTSKKHIRAWHTYSTMPWQFCLQRGLSPTLILIDGRFRVASFCATYLAAAEGATVLFDDFTDRPPYHVIKPLLKPASVHGRMAKFVIPSTRDMVAAALLLAEYSIQPR